MNKLVTILMKVASSKTTKIVYAGATIVGMLAKNKLKADAQAAFKEEIKSEILDDLLNALKQKDH